MTRFGDFAPLCHHVPSYPWCNLFYRQVILQPVTNRTFQRILIFYFKQFLDTGDNSTLSGLSSDRSSAPIGINPECGIPLVGHTNSLTTSSSLGNIADIIVCGVSIFVILALILWTSKRKAAVGKSNSFNAQHHGPVRAV